MNLFHKMIIALAGCMIFTSCEKMLEVDPPKTSLIPDVLFSTEQGATGAVTGLYLKLHTPSRFGNLRLTSLAGFSADELTFTGGTFDAFVNNRINVDSDYLINIWGGGYDVIYHANACIEGLQQSSALNPATKAQLMGEAYFVRAFTYFYLVNLFGELPLITSTDYQVNASEPRRSVELITTQIIEDCKKAKELLSPTYVATEKIRPNQSTATALLARVYLYNSNWTEAETESSAVINSNLYQLPAPAAAFLKNSTETIWQLSSQSLTASTNINTHEGNNFIPLSAASIPLYQLGTNLVNAFDSSDARKQHWVGQAIIGGNTFFYPYKYHVRTNAVSTEYPVMLRAAEQYLVRAEARAQLGKTEDAVSDINVIRVRASLPELSLTIDKDSCLAAIEKERRLEFFAELGHRWFDLKRTNRVNAVLGAIKPLWTPTAALWPLPQNELIVNPVLHQNAGY